MFFLLRMAFWLGVVLILLPSGGNHHAASTSQIDASDALSAASATVHDLKGFCSREPSACSVGSQLAAAAGERAAAGAKMLYGLFNQALAPRETGSVAGEQSRSETDNSSLQRASPNTSLLQRDSQNTLTPSDLNPAWRGPPARKVPRHPV
jgi:hypothetical protein